MLALVVVFALLLGAVLGGGLLVGALMVRRTEREVTAVRRDVVALHQDARLARLDARASLAELSIETGELRDRLAEDRRAVSTAHRAWDTRLSGLDGDIKDMHRVMAALESENVFLRRALQEVSAMWPALTNRVEAALADNPQGAAGANLQADTIHSLEFISLTQQRTKTWSADAVTGFQVSYLEDRLRIFYLVWGFKFTAAWLRKAHIQDFMPAVAADGTPAAGVFQRRAFQVANICCKAAARGKDTTCG